MPPLGLGEHWVVILAYQYWNQPFLVEYPSRDVHCTYLCVLCTLVYGTRCLVSWWLLGCLIWMDIVFNLYALSTHTSMQSSCYWRHKDKNMSVASMRYIVLRYPFHIFVTLSGQEFWVALRRSCSQRCQGESIFVKEWVYFIIPTINLYHKIKYMW